MYCQLSDIHEQVELMSENKNEDNIFVIRQNFASFAYQDDELD